MAKKKARKKTAVAPPASSVSVTLRRARNGYVVSSYSDKLSREITYIAKTKKEASTYADRLLGRA